MVGNSLDFLDVGKQWENFILWGLALLVCLRPRTCLGRLSFSTSIPKQELHFKQGIAFKTDDRKTLNYRSMIMLLENYEKQNFRLEKYRKKNPTVVVFHRIYTMNTLYSTSEKKILSRRGHETLSVTLWVRLSVTHSSIQQF